MSPLLFRPLQIRSVTLPNRIAISPMVLYRADKLGIVDDFHLVHLGRFALGGAGVVFTEAAAVEARGRTSDSDAGIWGDEHLPGLSRVAAFIKAQGSLAGIQLAHAGRKASMQTAPQGNSFLTERNIADGHLPWPIVGPADRAVGPGWIAPEALTCSEISKIVEKFAQAARRALQAGFDICEIHGAHGYLIASFLSPLSNTRQDEYGGDIHGRMKFALEVARAVRAAWPETMPLFFRVSAEDGGGPGGWRLDDTVVLARELKACGVDVVDCSSGGLTGPATLAPIKRFPGFQVRYSSAVRNEAGVASMAVGLIFKPEHAEKILQDGDADIIAIGREALYNPFWPLHAAQALRCDPAYDLWRADVGYWLHKRAGTLSAED